MRAAARHGGAGLEVGAGRKGVGAGIGGVAGSGGASSAGFGPVRGLTFPVPASERPEPRSALPAAMLPRPSRLARVGGTPWLQIRKHAGVPVTEPPAPPPSAPGPRVSAVSQFLVLWLCSITGKGVGNSDTGAVCHCHETIC